MTYGGEETDGRTRGGNTRRFGVNRSSTPNADETYVAATKVQRVLRAVCFFHRRRVLPLLVYVDFPRAQTTDAKQNGTERY